MRLEDEETNNHRSERLREQRVVSGEELLEGDEVIIGLTHLLARDGDHVIMHPVMHALFPEGRTTLRDLRLVMREDEIQTTAVDIELLTEVFRTHGRALHVPARKTFRPW